MLILVGNFLSIHGFNPTAIEDLSKVLLDSFPNIKFASNKKEPLCRLLDTLKIIFLNRKKCDLVIIDVFSSRFFYFSAIVIFLLKINKIPFIPVFRGGGLQDRFKRNIKLFNLLFREIKYIVCPSKFLGDFFINRGYNVKLIPNYIKLSNYTFKRRENIRARLIWVRSIHSIYNPIMAIKVLFIVKKIIPEVKLCMIGPFKDESVYEVKKLITNLGLKNNVILKGKMEKSAWIKISKEYDIFLNTTNIDNHPITLLEAMALGLPIISTNVGGVPHLIKNYKTGMLVPKNDVKLMAETIFLLINKKIDVDKITMNGRRFVEKFDLCNILPNWISIINEVKNDKLVS